MTDPFVKNHLWPLLRDALLTVVAVASTWWASSVLFPDWVERDATVPHGVVHTYGTLRLWLVALTAITAFTVVGVLRKRRHLLHLTLMGILLSAGVCAWIIVLPARSHGDTRVWFVFFIAGAAGAGLLFSTLIRRIQRRHG